MDKWYTTATIVAASAAAMATLGWLFGPPRPRTTDHTSSPLPEDDQYLRKHEEKLRLFMADLNRLLQEGDFEKAELVGNDILAYTEKVWGPRHLNYGLVLGVPMAAIYEATGNMKKLEESLQTAMSVLMESGEEILVDTGIIDKLMNCMSIKGNHSKAADYARILAKVRRDARNKSPHDPEVILKFGNSLSKVGMIFANAGQFKQAEAVFKEVLDVLIPAFPASNETHSCIEYYTNALHQQGKTNEAIKKIGEYKQIISSTESHNPVRRLLLRASTLSFAVDLFPQSLEYQKEAFALSVTRSLPPNCQMYADLATLYWELGNETDARSAQAQIKTFVINSSIPQQPLIRSKYLTTIKCSLNNGMYELQLRVNREPPQRREGDPLEDVESIKRKLDLCYLYITFDNTSSKNRDPVTLDYSVNSPHTFTVNSPQLEPGAPGWYEVVMCVYEDQKKHKKLGVHHQLIYCFG